MPETISKGNLVFTIDQRGHKLRDRRVYWGVELLCEVGDEVSEVTVELKPGVKKPVNLSLVYVGDA